MKKFILKLLIFCLLFFVFEKIFFIATLYLADNQVDKRLELLLSGQINKEVIAIGSSRGARGIVASQIEEETGQSAYNLSYPGSNIEFHEFILRTLVKYNKSPKTILLTVDDCAEFISNEGLIFRLDRLYPLVRYSYVRQELVDRGEKNWCLSKLTILHNLNISSIVNIKKAHFTPFDTIMNCGSMPISFQEKGQDWKFNYDETIYSIKKEDNKKINAFNNFIKICNQNKINLILVFPPNFYKQNKAFENRIKKLAGKKVRYFIYNTKNPIYQNKNIFHDNSHLIRNGAKLFTNEIVLFLKNER